MKKNLENIIIGSIFVLLIVLGVVANYINAEYNIYPFLLLINIIILIASPLYFFFYDFMEKRKKRNIEKSIIIKEIDFQYYRDIIKNYSPATLSFILDGTEFKKDLIASVIFLLNKGYIMLDETEVIKRTEKSIETLPQDLQLIVNNITTLLNPANNIKVQNKKGKTANEPSSSLLLGKKWTHLIEEEAKSQGLVIERTFKKTFTLLILFCIIEAIYALFIDKYVLFYFSGFLAFLLLFLKIGTQVNNKWIKTQKGYELYKKTVGLKNFIQDFSTISSENLEKIALWEDYLIYCLIFNDHSNLKKEALEFYKNISNKLR